MATIIIIPAYNEAAKIGEVISSVKSAGDWDIVVIDDGSIDATVESAKSAGAIVLRHGINRGQGAALKTGVEFASRSSYDTAVFFDADGQMVPEEIKMLLDKLAQGYDAVLGSRNLGQAPNMPLSRRLLKWLALIFTRMTTGLQLTDTHMGFQAWTVAALKKINLDQDRMAHASQILTEIARNKLKYVEMPVTIRYSDYSLRKGQTNWGMFKILWDLMIK